MNINLTFYWWTPGPEYDARPRCASSAEFDPANLLSEILGDDGGLSLESTMSWTDEGIFRIESVLSGELATAEWDREHWGASFAREMTEIYWLLDETHSQQIETSTFRNALVAWREFIGTPPLERREVNVEV